MPPISASDAMMFPSAPSYGPNAGWTQLSMNYANEGFETAPIVEAKDCAHCGSNTTQFWRKEGVGFYVCATCGMHSKPNNGLSRPQTQRAKPKATVTPVSFFWLF